MNQIITIYCEVWGKQVYGQKLFYYKFLFSFLLFIEFTCLLWYLQVLWTKCYWRFFPMKVFIMVKRLHMEKSHAVFVVFCLLIFINLVCSSWKLFFLSQVYVIFFNDDVFDFSRCFPVIFDTRRHINLLILCKNVRKCILWWFLRFSNNKL